MGQHRWKKGQSGNPAGRPKRVPGLVEEILRLTNDGKQLAQLLHDIATKQIVKVVSDNGHESYEGADTKDKISAIKLLLEYGIGKPVEHHEVGGVGAFEELISGSFELEPSEN